MADELAHSAAVYRMVRPEHREACGGCYHHKGVIPQGEESGQVKTLEGGFW